MKFPYESVDFDITWQEWLDFRAEIKKPYKSERSIQRQLKWFRDQKLSVQQAIECIETSIRNGWQGIFEPKNKTNASSEGVNQARKGGRNQGTIDFFNETAAEYAARHGGNGGGKI